LTLQLDREFLGEALALLRLVLTGHHLPQFFVRFRVLCLTINVRGVGQVGQSVHMFQEVQRLGGGNMRTLSTSVSIR